MFRTKKESTKEQDLHGMASQVEASQNGMREKIIHLFAPSEAATNTGQARERQISTIEHDFLRATNVSTDIELRSLQEKFKDSKIPTEPSDVGSYLEYLASNVVAHSIHTASPRFIGHMTSALPAFVPSMGKLMMAMNQNVVKIETAKSLSPYERQTLAMIHRLIYGFSDDFYNQHIQQSESTLGVLTSGGTLANITALWCARNACFGPKGGFSGIENEGLPAALEFYGARGAVIIGSSLMHYSFEKAAGLLGIGTRNLKRVATDHNSRIDLHKLRQTIAACNARDQRIIALVGIAGATDTGAIDPLSEMADIAQDAGIHFHVDAAWGGAVLFSERYRHKLAGIKRADSVTIDAHKQLYTPMGIGMVMLRNPQMAKVIEKQARYIARAGSADLGKRALEGSRPGMALFLHATLNIIGWKGYEFLIDEGIRKTQYVANSIRARPEFELLIEPEINILTYRYLPEAFREKAAVGGLTEADDAAINQTNEALQRVQRRDGCNFVSRTKLDVGHCAKGASIVALRVVISNPLTTEDDIDAVLDDQIRIATTGVGGDLRSTAHANRGSVDSHLGRGAQTGASRCP